MSYLWANIRHNLRTLHNSPLSELAGSLGDMGTLLPILVAMSKTNTISLPSTLIFSGLWNLLSGIIFGIPIVTQPMKAIAATSLHAQLTLQETMAAGLGVAAVVLLLSVTGLLTRLATLIPIPIIKGIQLGAGLSMVLTAGRTLMKLDLSSQQWYDNNFWTLTAFVVLYGTSRYPHKVPFAILVFVLGVMVSGLRLQLGGEPLPSWGWEGLQVTVPSSMDFARGFGVAGLGQVPLTVLNSVVAVRYLSQDLLPEKGPPGIAALGVSVGVMNLIGCWFGAMPVCHGSGGLAGQYRFGARSGGSIMALGLFKIVVGFVFGSSLMGLLERFPSSILGIMVFAAGMELLSVGEDLNSTAADLCGRRIPGVPQMQRPLDPQVKKDRYTVMMVTAGMYVAFQNGFAGFVAGCLCWALLEVQDRMQVWSENGSEASEASEETALLS